MFRYLSIPEVSYSFAQFIVCMENLLLPNVCFILLFSNDSGKALAMTVSSDSTATANVRAAIMQYVQIKPSSCYYAGINVYCTNVNY